MTVNAEIPEIDILAAPGLASAEPEPRLGDVNMYGQGQVARAATPVKVELVNPLEDSDWDRKVLTWPEATIFHSREWAEALVATYPLKPLYLWSEEGGLLPLMEAVSPLTGRRGVALPFTDLCPFLGTHAEVRRALVDSAMDLGRQRAWRYLEFKGAELPDVTGPSSLTYYGHTIHLDRPKEELFSRMESAARRAVRKAESEGVYVEFESSEGALAHFFRLHSQTRRKHGLPPQPYRFFQNILRCLVVGDLGELVLAWHEGRPVAGALFLKFGRTVMLKFAASNLSCQHLRGNNLLMWAAIQRYAGQGFARMDLGRTSVGNQGLRRFKTSLGADEAQLRYHKYHYGKRCFVTENDMAMGWYTRVFQLMPTLPSRMVGRVLYKHLA